MPELETVLESAFLIPECWKVLVPALRSEMPGVKLAFVSESTGSVQNAPSRWNVAVPVESVG